MSTSWREPETAGTREQAKASGASGSDARTDTVPLASPEQALAKHRDEQAALYRFTDRLYRAEAVDEVYAAALDAIRQALGCERASILLFDEAGLMKFVAWQGLSDGYRAAVEGHSPWQPTAKDPGIICIADVHSADLPSDLRRVIKAEGIGGLAFIPLVMRGRLVGKFMTYHDRPYRFSDADKGLALTIARQLGFGIERMRAEETRRRAEQVNRHLASIIENSADAIISRDLAGIVTSWNDGATRMYGYSAAEMLGNRLDRLIPPNCLDQEALVLTRVRSGEAVEPYETVRRRKDGVLVDVSITVSPIRDQTGTVIGASKIARDIRERKQAQARQELLTKEIHHRTKNLFAVVISVVMRSFAGKQTVLEAKEAVVGRLRSLAETQDLLINNDWHGAALSDVIEREMKPYSDRVSAQGPRVLLKSKAAQNFALALHELATNAAKYGALSNSSGHIAISWQADEPSDHFTFRWLERGGPRVSQPPGRGFGSAVLEQVIAQHFDAAAHMDFDAQGVTYQVTCSLSALSPQLDT